ncbi:MAG TPA: anti-sigma factor [Methylomirabilota bacterium]|nr:anti-sigma factor [Methylomirabilota bacterium]
MSEMTHSQVEELAGAFALGALDSDEEAAVRAHLAECGEAHPEMEAALGAGIVMAESLDPVDPSAAVRDRLMATIERTPQAHRQAVAQPVRQSRRGWLDWLSPRVARPLAIAAMAAVIAVGAWSLGLQSQLNQRDAALRAVASAISGGQAAFRVEGNAGRGYVVDTPGRGAALVVTDLAELPPHRIYELWLLNPAGSPVAVGTLTSTDDAIAVVQLERDLSGFSIFAVTVEAERVAAPSSDPVILGVLGSS